jgi:prepilin-type processing-associated H-X9-DG protein
MNNRSAQLAIIAILVICGSLAGCGAVQQAQNAAKRQQMMNNMQQLGLAYHNCHDATTRGPANWQEAQQYGLPAEAQAEIAHYTVIWGVKMADAMGGTANFALAYPPDAATNGGPVLFLDGSVRQMTAEEFNATLAQQKIDSPKAMGDGPDAPASDSGDGAAPADASSSPGSPAPPAP